MLALAELMFEGLILGRHDVCAVVVTGMYAVCIFGRGQGSGGSRKGR